MSPFTQFPVKNYVRTASPLNLSEGNWIFEQLIKDTNTIIVSIKINFDIFNKCKRFDINYM